jgi:ketosteroid isomerase-like protein
MESVNQTDAALRQKNYELDQHFMSIAGTPDGFALMDENIVVEFPYAGSLGSKEKYEGKATVVNYLTQMLAQVGDLNFEGIVTTGTVDPDLFFNEYYADIVTPAGKKYRQVYINKVRIKDGKITYIKELWDTKRIIDAIDFKIKN